jgi:DNA-binding GntR family transcriptional regulator
MTKDKSNIIPRRSLQEEIASLLREEIVEGVWKPGTRLQERVLCEHFGVSRPPLREACRVIAAEGLLELRPNRGAVVTRPTMVDAVENMEIIVVLQLFAIRLACERASDQQLTVIKRLQSEMHTCGMHHEMVRFFELNTAIHHAIVAASGNSALVSMYEHVARHITRFQNLAGAFESDPQLSIHEHKRFVNALLKRNAPAATAALEAHLNTVTEMVKERVSENGLMIRQVP